MAIERASHPRTGGLARGDGGGEAERTLREIAVRVSSILDPTEVLDRIVVEAISSQSDGSRIDLWDEESGSLLWAYSAGDAMRDVPDWGRTSGIKPGEAVAGQAFRDQQPYMTADYLADPRFVTTPAIARFILSLQERRHPGRRRGAAHGRG